MRGLNILKQSEPPVNKPNSKLQALKTNLESNIPTEYDNLFNQKEVRKSNLDLTNQDYLTGYENYNDYAGGLDLNEIRAQNQPIFDKAAAGVGRIGTKAISEIAKMPGVIGGIIAAPFAEEGQGMETAFNNQWIKSISQFNEDVNAELLPVYVKKAVSEGNLWDNISSIDFWATEGADGIGFIASMFAPGAVLKSLNLGQKILGTTAKGLSMVNGEAKLAGAARTLEGLGINANKIDMAGITMANTLFESGSEAGSAMESFQKDLDRRLASGEIDQFQYEELQTQKAKLGRDIFVSNLAILLIPNAIQTKMIWGKGVGSQLVKDTPSLMTKVANRGKNVLGALGSEGFLEEGLQSTVETMFSNKAKRGELTDDMSQDFNVSELVSNYIDTLNTTEGQKAIFLGGVLGGGMSAYQGGKSDIATRKQTQDVLSLAEEKVGVFNRINETDVYKRDENGDVVYNYNNQPQYDPVKVRDVAKALEYTEQQSQLFDQAIQEGNTQVIQTLKNEAINQLITPFINKGELGIQALSQYLDTTLKTEEIAGNEDAKALKSKIIEQATYMQDQLNTYKDFSKSLINLNNPDATEQDIADYYNRLGDVYINLKGSEYFQKGELKKLNTQKTKLLKDLGDTEISTELNPDYIEGKDEEIYKFNRKPVDSRVKLLNDQIEEVNKKLSEIDKIINDEIWNDEKVNKSFNKRVEENNKLREQASAENEAIVNQAAETIANATTVDELKNLPKTNTPADTVVKKQAEAKKAEIIEAEEIKNAEEINTATQEDNDFNNVTTYSDLTGTEGSPVTDELTPEDNDNSTAEEIEKVKNEEVLAGKGAQVISSYLKDDERGQYKSGETIPFMFTQYGPYLEYEKTPIDKSGKEVGFEINTNPGPNKNLNIALQMLEKKDFSNPAFLISYLPINVVFEKGIKAPTETRRASGKLDAKKDKDGKDQFYINPATEILRTHIVNHLINGGSISDIKTTIQDQYKGLLKVDDNRLANNNILELDGVPNLKYVRDNLYVVDSFGNLKNIQTGKTKPFSNGKVKSNAKGEIYLEIPQANGKPFPLKLNIKKINESEAVLLYEIYKEIITNEKSLNTTISETNPELQEAILTSFEAELNIIGGNKNDIKLQEIVDLLIYQSDNIKSRMQIENGVLYFGENEANIDTIEESQNAIINYLVDSKRHQIKINPKFATDNTKTNLKSNSADYLKYLIDNNILTTNAVINEPTFQGYTNIYLNTGIIINNQVKSKIEKVEISSEIADIEKRRKIELNKKSIQGTLKNSPLEDILYYENKVKEAKQKLDKITSREGEFIPGSDRELDAFKSLLFKARQKVDKINLKFNSELKLLEQQFTENIKLSPTDKIIFGHPGIGKTFLRENGRTDVIDFDSDYKSRINKKFNLPEGFKARNEFQKSNKEEYQKAVRELWKEAKQEAKETDKQLFASDMILLREFINDFDKIITMSKETFVNRAKQRNDYKEGETESWKNSLDIEIAKISKSKIIKTDKYLSDLFEDKINNKSTFLNQPKVSESGVEVKTDNFEGLDFGDKQVVTQPITGLSITYTPTGKQSQTYTINKNKIINSKGEEVFKEDSADRRKIFANVAVKEGRAKVIEDNKGVKYVVNNKQQIMSTATGKIMEWADNHATRKLLLNKYNKLVQPEISDSLFENNSQNNRNSQESFVSLSEIPGTMENTELNKTQAEVFNEVTNVPSATEMRLLNKAADVFKNNPSELTDIQRQRLEEAAVKYPETYKKLCQ